MGRRERNDRFAKKRDSRTVNLQSNRLADTFSSSICVGKNLSGHLNCAKIRVFFCQVLKYSLYVLKLVSLSLSLSLVLGKCNCFKREEIPSLEKLSRTRINGKKLQFNALTSLEIRN